jgi:hypothetical protein
MSVRRDMSRCLIHTVFFFFFFFFNENETLSSMGWLEAPQNIKQVPDWILVGEFLSSQSLRLRGEEVLVPAGFAIGGGSGLSHIYGHNPARETGEDVHFGKGPLECLETYLCQQGPGYC